jgi:Tol biopolymer transport system component
MVDGTRLSYFISHENSYTMEVGKSWKDQVPQPLAPTTDPDEKFMAHSWSHDGRKLAGPLLRPDGVASGIAIYSFDSKKYQKLTNFGLFPIWLKDGHRLIFCFKEKLYLLDSHSKKFHEIMYSPLSARTGEMLGITSLSPDERTLYFAEGTIEADIWLLTME